MSDRPILGVDEPKPQSKGSPPTAPASSTGGNELPLAIELPSWDLLPSDTLLVRRRPAKV
jgi:hypothetical protein